MTEDLLRVEGLTVRFGAVPAIEDVSFALRPGETLAIVGESSSGKSVTALALMRLLDQRTCSVAGRALLRGPDGQQTDLLALPERAMADLRGRALGMIFQEPMTSLNPSYTVGDQIAESVVRHKGASKREALRHAAEMLRRVRIPNPETRVHDYPHRMSGGMRQRVMIAMALANEPALIIADEPTTALDVTTQAQILKLMRELQARHDSGILFITHDFGVVAEIADRVVVMRQGRLVEQGTAEEVLTNPQDPYTRMLIDAVPSATPRGASR